ncbi:MAG: sodium:solute symporter family protein [Fimbriimonas sp.]
MPLAMALAPLDIGVVGLFLVAILALGFSARLRENSTLQFLAAGRSLTLPAFVATLVSTWYGGILGMGESVSYYGFGTWLLMGVPYYVFALLYAVWLAPRVRGADQLSIPERLASRYGKRVALLGAGLVFLLAVPAAHVLMLGVLVQELSGWDRLPAIFLAVVIGTAFLYRGGLLADVRVGLLAFVMMYVGFGAIVVYCVLNHPPAQAFAAIENKTLLTFTGGSKWPAMVSFFVLGAWTLVDPGFHQRVSACESPEVGRRGVLVSTGFWVLFDLLSIATGMYALALLRPMPTEPLTIFPRLGDQVLPPGLKGLFLCGMLGTITSALVGYTLVAGATMGREMVARVRAIDEPTTNVWIRIGFVVASVVAILLALGIKSVVALWYAWAGAVVGALLIPTAMAYGRRVPRPKVAFTAMALAFGVSLGWLVYSQRTNNPFQEVAWVRTGNGGRFALPPLPEALQAEATTFSLGTLLPGLVISALVIGLGRLLGKGDPATEEREA